MLRRKGKSHEAKETRGKYSKGKSIRKRDKSVYSRQESGRREAGTAVSGQGKSKACFAALAERKTRFYIAVKIPGRKAETMENAIVAARSAFPAQLVKAITCARGTEFANWLQIEERLHCEVYFADPYCAWQKGTNENLNGLLREFYPRGRNLSRVAPATLKRGLALLNARPRKVLNFRSAQDLWDFQLNSCCAWFDNSLACERGKACFCAPQGRLYRAVRRLAHARWQAFTSSTMGMTHNASPSATAYSARLICVKPKASEMPGR